jgi:tetratricopeptide (TPR) repeat protein
MRYAAFISVVLSVGFQPAIAFAQKVGDQIVTIRKAKLRSGDNRTRHIPQGNILVVKGIKADGFQVDYAKEHESNSGWINRSDVIPFSQAIDFFTDELSRSPTALSYSIRASIWTRKGEYEIAIGDYTDAIRLNPKDGSYYNNRARAWDAKKEYDKAIIDYNEAIRLDPKDAVAYNNRGAAWSAKQEYGKAITNFDEAIRLDPKLESSYSHRADALCARKEYDKAIADYNEAIRLEPKKSTLYTNRGIIWFDKKDYERAIADQSEAIRLDPNNAVAYANRGAIQFTKKEYGKAIADYAEAIRVDPKNAQICREFAWVSAICPDRQFRDGERAVKIATRACELTDWKSPKYLATLAAAYAETGDFEAAVKWDTEALEFAPEEDKAEYRARLELFKDRKPLRMD